MSEFKRGFVKPQPAKQDTNFSSSSSSFSSSSSSGFNPNNPSGFNPNGSNGSNGASKSTGVVIQTVTPDEIWAHVIPPDATLFGDRHLMRGDIGVLAGPPGVGKSRAAIALAIAGAAKCRWFDYQVHRKFKTLIIQNENSIHRLQLEFEQIGECVRHCLEILLPPECGLDFDDPSFRDGIQKAIAAFKPDLIIIDPWNAVCPGDKQPDVAKAFKNIRKVIPASIDGPAILIVHHVRKSNGQNHAGGRDLLNEIAGSYMIGSIPRACFVMQHASPDPLSDEVVFSCCKNSNGKPGARSAWKRNAGGLFDFVPDFDWSKFDSGGQNCETQCWSQIPDLIRNNSGFVAKTDLAKLVMGQFGVSQKTAYRQIEKAGQSGIIRFDMQRKGYVPA